MIPTGVQIFLALEPVDMRWSFDRLSGVAYEAIGYDARSGALFVFYGRRKRRSPFNIPIEYRHDSLSMAPASREARKACCKHCEERSRRRPRRSQRRDLARAS